MELTCKIGNAGLECNNCSDVFNYYKQRKEEIITNLIRGDLSTSYILDTDNHCLWNMASYRRKPIKDRLILNEVSSNRHFKCLNCRQLEYLMDVNGKLPLTFNCKGVIAEITEIVGVNIYSKLIDNKLYLDHFTNKTILNWYLDKENVSRVLKNYYAFICRGNGYSISKHNKITNIEEIPDGDLISIIYQMLKILKILEKYDFSIHGRINSLFTIRESKVYLNDLSKCSLSVQTDNSVVRVCPFDLSINGKSTLKKMKYELMDGSTRRLYITGDVKKIIQTSNFDVGVSRSSLNLYLIIYNLMSYKNVSKFIYSYKETYELWKKLWLPSDFNMLTFTIKDLDTLRLRDDALDYFLEGIKGML